jgi:hypothetical protein
VCCVGCVCVAVVRQGSLQGGCGNLPAGEPGDIGAPGSFYLLVPPHWRIAALCSSAALPLCCHSASLPLSPYDQFCCHVAHSVRLSPSSCHACTQVRCELPILILVVSGQGDARRLLARTGPAVLTPTTLVSQDGVFLPPTPLPCCSTVATRSLSSASLIMGWSFNVCYRSEQLCVHVCRVSLHCHSCEDSRMPRACTTSLWCCQGMLIMEDGSRGFATYFLSLKSD